MKWMCYAYLKGLTLFFNFDICVYWELIIWLLYLYLNKLFDWREEKRLSMLFDKLCHSSVWLSARHVYVCSFVSS